MATASPVVRNALADAATHGQKFRDGVHALLRGRIDLSIEMLDAAADIGSLLDTWSRRNPLRVTTGERRMMHDIFEDAREELIDIEHDPALDQMLAAAEHHFNAALGITTPSQMAEVAHV